MNHRYNTPPKGADDWHIPLNDNFTELDRDVEIRDTSGNLGSYEPLQGAKFLATDSGQCYIGDGTNWVPLNVGHNGQTVIISNESGTIRAHGQSSEIASGSNLGDIVNTAVASLDAPVGGKILFKGDYSISSGEEIDVDITNKFVAFHGLGQIGTRFIIPNDIPAFSVNASPTAGFEIANLMFNSNATSPSNYLINVDAGWGRIYGNYFDDANGIRFRSDHTNIYLNEFEDCMVCIDGHQNSSRPLFLTMIHNNFLTSVQGGVNAIEMPQGPNGEISQNGVINNNTIHFAESSGSTGIYGYGTRRFTVSGNHITGADSGIRLEGPTEDNAVGSNSFAFVNEPYSVGSQDQRTRIEGLGDNGSNDPASGGPWSGSGFEGTEVIWDDGSGTTFKSIYRRGGWHSVQLS